MEKIVKTFNEQIANAGFFGLGSGYYVQDANIHFHLYDGSLKITDLTNALVRGKSVTTVSIGWNRWEQHATLGGLKVLVAFNYDLKAILNHFIAAIPEEKKSETYTSFRTEAAGIELDITVNAGEYNKGMNCFSPFALSNIKPLTEAPKKWTLTHAIRAIVNGQYDALNKDMKLTDDYAYDAAYNFGKGEMDGLFFAQKLIEAGSNRGWWVMAEGNKISVSQHHFDYNHFTLNLEKKRNLTELLETVA